MRSAVLGIAVHVIVASCFGGFIAPLAVGVAQERAGKATKPGSQGLRFRRVFVVEEQLQKLADKFNLASSLPRKSLSLNRCSTFASCLKKYPHPGSLFGKDIP